MAGKDHIPLVAGKDHISQWLALIICSRTQRCRGLAFQRTRFPFSCFRNDKRACEVYLSTIHRRCYDTMPSVKWPRAGKAHISRIQPAAFWLARITSLGRKLTIKDHISQGPGRWITVHSGQRRTAVALRGRRPIGAKMILDSARISTILGADATHSIVPYRRIPRASGLSAA